MLELMAHGGMRIGEVLKLKPYDIQKSSLTIQNPKSGRVGETVYVPLTRVGILPRPYSSNLQSCLMHFIKSCDLAIFVTKTSFEQ